MFLFTLSYFLDTTSNTIFAPNRQPITAFVDKTLNRAIYTEYIVPHRQFMEALRAMENL